DERVMSCAENSEIGECIGAAALQPDDVMGFQVGGRGADAAPWLTAQGLIGVARVAKAGSRVVGCLLRLGHGPVSSHADITISRCRYHNRLPGERNTPTRNWPAIGDEQRIDAHNARRTPRPITPGGTCHRRAPTRVIGCDVVRSERTSVD